MRERPAPAQRRRFHMTMLRDNKAARLLASHVGPATVLPAAGNVVNLSYWI